LEVVKELMGHRSISMTLRYTQLYEATKRRQYDQAMAHIEQLFDFLIEQQILDVNPVKPSHMLRRGRTPPKALS